MSYDHVALKRPANVRTLAQTLQKMIASRTGLTMMIVGGLLTSLFRTIRSWNRRRREHRDWKRHADLSVVQACILTTEHLETLGRVEKRTLFIKPLSEVFKNEYMLSQVLDSARRAAESQDPFLLSHLSEEYKWNVLNTCMNHLSSCFAPYHVFFNEARRVESYYQSAWYCFTLTCAQTDAAGRWFVTPRKPVHAIGDVGMLRIRIVMMNESELRDVASGAIEPDPNIGFMYGRQRTRWEGVQRFAELFERQVRHATDDKPDSPRPYSDADGCDVKHGGGEAEDNQILRIHVPFPGSAHATERKAVDNVVLFE